MSATYLRILHIIPNLLQGGAERIVIDICNELNSRSDIQILLILLSKEIGYPTDDLNFQYKIIQPNVKLSLTKRNQIDISKLQEAITSFKPNIIHTHLFYAELVSRFCFYPEAKWFSHCHDNMRQLVSTTKLPHLNKQKIILWYEKKLLFNGYKKNGGTYFLAISKDTERFFLTYGQPYKVLLFPNAINFNSFYSPLKADKAKKLKLINIGSLVDKKNQIFLLKVAQVLLERKIEFELSLIGSGPNKVHLENMINKLGLKPYVFLLGSRNDVPGKLSQANIYVHSATYEPFGLVLLEAMAAGLPTISLAAGGNIDIIKNDVNGCIIDKSSSESEFADKIVTLWLDKEKLYSLANAAQQFARQYDIFNYTTKLIDVYKTS